MYFSIKAVHYPKINFAGVQNQCRGANILQLIQDLHVTAGSQRKEATGTPNNCFLLNICLEKQKLCRIFYSLRKAKNF